MREATIKRIEDQCKWDGDCLIWQGGRNSGGHPMMSYCGKTGSLVRRVLQEARTGRTLPRGVVMRPICGEKLCLAKDHCKEMTRGQAMKQAGSLGALSKVDKVIACHKGAKKKLTAEDVAAIRASDKSNVELGREYGVCHTNISRIKLGHSWRKAFGASVFAWRPAA